MTDVVVKRLRAKPLTWGSASLMGMHAARAAYAAAVRAADNDDIRPLVTFARS
jgi:hypothetical protein